MAIFVKAPAYKEVEFTAISGKAFNSQKRTETHIESHGGGGGGYVSGGSGYVSVSAPTIESTVITKHDFWVQAADGVQIPVQLIDADIPLAEGQDISVVYGRRSGGPTKEPVAVVNYSARRYWNLGFSKELANEIAGPAKGWAIGVFIALIVLWIYRQDWLTFIAAIAWLAYRLFVAVGRSRSAVKRLSENVDTIAKSLLSDPAAAARPLPSVVR